MKNWNRMILLFVTLAACSGEHAGYENLRIQWKAEDPTVLQIKRGTNSWQQITNGDGFTVEFTTQTTNAQPWYHLNYSGNYQFDYCWFTGYDNQNDPLQEMEFITKTSNAFQISGKLVTSEVYEITLSQKK